MTKPSLEELEAAYHSGEVILGMGKVVKMMVSYPIKQEYKSHEKAIYHREKDGVIYVFEVVEESLEK